MSQGVAASQDVVGDVKVGEKRNHEALENSSGKTLLFAAQQFELLYNTQSMADLKTLVAPNVRLHKDSIFTHRDIYGVEHLENYFKAFFKKYQYKHTSVVLAVDASKAVAFSLSVDSDVRPKEGVFTKLSEGETASSRCISIWKYQFNDSGLITDIWFLRQPSRDEMARKFVSPPDYTQFDFDPVKWAGPQLEHDAARTQKMQAAAETFAAIWAGVTPPTAADNIMASDVKEENLLFGGAKQGRQAFIDTINGAMKVWHPDSTHNDIAVTPSGNKAFIHWTAKGKQSDTDQDNNLYGLNLLVFNEAGQITEIVGFRQPLASERPHLLKSNAE